MSDCTGPTIRIDDQWILPCGDHVRIASESQTMYFAYFETLRLLLLAGFCFLLLCLPSFGDDIFKPTGRYAVQKTTRQWYLVSESWCSNCPAAKAKFRAKGWSESNVLTIEECRARFGFTVPHVPYEFPEPQAKPQGKIEPPVRIVETVRMREYVPKRRGFFGWNR